MNFNYKATPKKIIRFLDKCNSHAQWEKICNDLDNDDITKLIQDRYLIEENGGYIRIGSKLRHYHKEFCKRTDELQSLLEFKTHITKLNIAGEELQYFMGSIKTKYRDNERFELDYKRLVSSLIAYLIYVR